MTVAVRSFAKINLGLYIGAARADGFHDLRTVYQTIALHDVIRVSVGRTIGRGSGIEILCKDPRVPLDSSNTCYRVAARVMDQLGLKSKIDIEIEKRLPVQGGLGAASSNAVATMIALERALKKRLPADVRLRIASEVGSDLPLFLVGGTTLGVGRGEEVYPLEDFASVPMVVVTPEVGVSTPQAFATWDALTKTGHNSSRQLTKRDRPIDCLRLAARFRRGLVVQATLMVTPTPVLPQKAGAGPGTCFPTLSVPGLKTTSRKSSFLNIPNCETLKVRWNARALDTLRFLAQGQPCMGFSGREPMR